MMCNIMLSIKSRKLLLSLKQTIKAPLSSLVTSKSMRQNHVVIALGSNMGDSSKVLTETVSQLQSLAIGNVESTSFLYESKPMYYSDQSSFLNAACLLKTHLSPEDLLIKLKELERKIGRQETFRNGPRLIDLDIVFYNNECFNSSDLQIPHLRMHERVFVLKPCLDIIPDFIHPQLMKSIHQLWLELSVENKKGCQRVMPVGKYQNNSRRMLSMEKKAYISGILNVTPDSFSDGGQYNSNITASVDRVKEMLMEGAHMIDIGGESTRPGAAEVEVDVQLQRVLPVIRAIRQQGLDCILSIDTRHAEVAKQAIEAGADIINDVSGGQFDSHMIHVAHDLGVPMIYMHSRGTPLTMTHSTHTTYQDLIEEISTELKQQITKGAEVGIPRWLQIVDPGIGFAKSLEHNMTLLNPSDLKRFRRNMSDRMVMIGLSRKKFVQTVLQQCRENDHFHSSSSSSSDTAGTATDSSAGSSAGTATDSSAGSSAGTGTDSSAGSSAGTGTGSSAGTDKRSSFQVAQVADQRDYGTIGACLATLLSSSDKADESTAGVVALLQQQTQCHSLPVESSVILRVHNVKAVREAVDLFTEVIWPTCSSSSSSSINHSNRSSSSINKV